jgi:hypothetical protein
MHSLELEQTSNNNKVVKWMEFASPAKNSGRSFAFSSHCNFFVTKCSAYPKNEGREKKKKKKN